MFHLLEKDSDIMSREHDAQLIQQIPKEKLPEFIFLHLRNMWAVDGLYYMGIEKISNTEQATDIDRQVWEVMGKIEARRLKQFFHITNDDIPSMMKALEYSGWALDLEDKEIEIQPKQAIIRNITCRVQNTRIKKGLGEFGCKPVRFGYLNAFAKEFNSNIKVTCTMCPPDKHPDDLWCEWVFTLK